MTTTTWQEEAAEIWKLLRETNEQMKEADARLTAQFRETDARLTAQFRETDARLNKLFAQTDRKIDKLAGTFGQQWGRLVEVLIKLDVVKLFQARKIDIKYVTSRMKRELGSETMELDLILHNGDELVVVETKSTMQVQDVNDFLEDLADFDRFFPEYRSHKRYGAVAALDFDREVSRYAYRKGLFVLAITGQDLVELKNGAEFKPRNFNTL